MRLNHSHHAHGRAPEVILLAILLVTIACNTSAWAQQRITPSSRRAPFPKWPADQVAEVFFANAFSEALRGQRPVASSSSKTDANSLPISPDSAATSKRRFQWSGVISAETIEDEVKSLKLSVDATITTPQKFSANGYHRARDDFSLLALLFGIIHEFDGDIRWKRGAEGLRDRFALVAMNCKVGTLPVFKQAQQSKQMLEDVINGSLPKQSPGQGDSKWGAVVSRGPLMNRLETAYEERISKWTSGPAEASANRDRIIHEAHITAAIAEVLSREGMQEADEDDYAEHCRNMKSYALEIIQGLEQQDPRATREAVGGLYKTCSSCHESYRS